MTKRENKSNKFSAIGIKFREKKYELTFSFIAMVLGIFIGFQLENYRQKKSDNNSTKVRLHFMYIESLDNLKKSYNAFNNYNLTDTFETDTMVLESQSARTVLEDENIINILSHYKVSLIQDYINDVTRINNINEKYFSYFDGYRYTQTRSSLRLEELLLNNIISLMATCTVLQEQLKEYFDKKLYNLENIKTSQARITTIQQKISDGEFEFEKYIQ